MTAFEQFLISKGYERFQHSDRHTYIKKKFYGYSTMGCSWSVYFKQGVVSNGELCSTANKNECIVFGLRERHKPPTLVHPRPRIQLFQREGDKVFVLDEQFDDIMNRVLDTVDFEIIYEAMFDPSKIIKLD